jgi:hypothetical protein
VADLKDKEIFGLPLKNYSVNVSVNEALATILIQQTYVNDLDTAIEATLTFPSEKDVVVSSMKITMNEKEIETKVMEKQKA